MYKLYNCVKYLPEQWDIYKPNQIGNNIYMAIIEQAS